MKEPIRWDHPRERRLLSKADFDLVYRSRRRISRRSFAVYFTPGATADSRLGISAGRRAGNAVRRNWLKRRVREAFRTHPGLREQSVDLVFHATGPVTDLPGAEFAREVRLVLEEVCRRGGA